VERALSRHAAYNGRFSHLWQFITLAFRELQRKEVYPRGGKLTARIPKSARQRFVPAARVACDGKAQLEKEELKGLEIVKKNTKLRLKPFVSRKRC
jgi:NAD kinase